MIYPCAAGGITINVYYIPNTIALLAFCTVYEKMKKYE